MPTSLATRIATNKSKTPLFERAGVTSAHSQARRALGSVTGVLGVPVSRERLGINKMLPLSSKNASLPRHQCRQTTTLQRRGQAAVAALSYSKARPLRPASVRPDKKGHVRCKRS